MPLLPSHTLLQSYSLVLVLTSYLLFTSPSTLLNAAPLWILGESMHIRPATFTPPDAQHTVIHTPSASLQRRSSNPMTSTDRPTTELLCIIALVLLLASLTQSILSNPLRYTLSDLQSLASKSITKATLRASVKSQTEADATASLAEKIAILHGTQTLFLTLSTMRVLLEGALVAGIYLFYADRSSQNSGGAASYQDQSHQTGILSQLANRLVFSFTLGDMLFWGYLWTVLREESREIAQVVAERRRMVEQEDD